MVHIISSAVKERKGREGVMDASRIFCKGRGSPKRGKVKQGLSHGKKSPIRRRKASHMEKNAVHKEKMPSIRQKKPRT